MVTLHFTEKERLIRYKVALAYMLKGRDFMRGHGICYALSEGLGTYSEYYPTGEYEIKEMYPELWKHRPHRVRLSFWWDEESLRGYNTRIRVLKRIIKEMEG